MKEQTDPDVVSKVLSCYQERRSSETGKPGNLEMFLRWTRLRARSQLQIYKENKNI